MKDIRDKIAKHLDYWDFDGAVRVFKASLEYDDINKDYQNFLFLTATGKGNIEYQNDENCRQIAHINQVLLSDIDPLKINVAKCIDLLKICVKHKNQKTLIGCHFFICNLINLLGVNEKYDFFFDNYVRVMLTMLLTQDLSRGAKRYYKILADILNKKEVQANSLKTAGRVALCMLGALRGDFVRNINDNYGQFSNLKPDVIVCSWKNYHIWPGFGGNGVFFKRIFPKNVIDKIPSEIHATGDFIKLFPKTSFKLKVPIQNQIRDEMLKNIANLRHYKLIDEREFDDLCNRNLAIENRVGLVNTYKLVYQMQMAKEAVQECEKKMGYKYDYVIMSRPDMKFQINITESDLESLAFNEIYETTHSIGNDATIYIGRRDAIFKYCSIWEHAKFNQSLDIFKTFPQMYISIHYLTHRWSNMHNIQVRNFGTLLKRFAWADAECIKGYKLPDLTEDLQSDLKELGKIKDDAKMKEFTDFFDLVVKAFSGLSKQEIDENAKIISQVETKNIIDALSTDLEALNKKIDFTTKYGTANSRIKNQLSFRLGKAVLECRRSFFGYIKLPFVLSYIYDEYKKEQLTYKNEIEKNPSLKLPKLKDYSDYKEALKIKDGLEYKLGESLIKASKTWYKGGFLKMLRICA